MQGLLVLLLPIISNLPKLFAGVLLFIKGAQIVIPS